jgi:hypothetical protein
MNSKEMSDIQQLERQVGGIDKKVSSILVLLKGHEMDNDDKGMIGELKDHEKRLEALEKMKDRLVYFLIGLSIPAGWGLIDIIQSVIIKK